MATVQQDEKGLSELVARLSANAKAYAKAEVDYWKTTATVRARSAKSAAIMGILALLLATGAFVALIVGLLMSLSTRIGPLAATAVVVLVTLAIAGMLGFMAAKGFQRMMGGGK